MTEFRAIRLADITLRAVVRGSGPLVVMVHGFPESWYSWRHQIGPIADAGFTACAIDVRGYGGSDKPSRVEDYAMERMIADIAGVVTALSDDGRAVLIGHDWGAPMVWNTALACPDRVRAVAGLSVPYLGIPKRSFRETFEEVFTRRGKFFYQAYFQTPGVAEAELEANPRDSLRRFYYAISGDAPDGTWPNDKPVDARLLDRLPDPQPFPAWLTEADIDYFTGEFERSGFAGPLNRYRNHDLDFDYLQSFKGRRIEQPAAFIGGERDLVLSMLGRGDLMAIMKAEAPDLRTCEILEGCGHWTQQERPQIVTDLLLNWLRRL